MEVDPLSTSNFTPFVPASLIRYQHNLARNRLWAAIRGGYVEHKTECEVCGSCDMVQAHHEDYSQPLAVRWLCKDCHFSHHGARRGEPR